jgi:hypothetical protein
MTFWYSVLVHDEQLGCERVLATFTEEWGAQAWIEDMVGEEPEKLFSIVRHRVLDWDEVE